MIYKLKCLVGNVNFCSKFISIFKRSFIDSFLGYGTEKTHVSNRKTDKIDELFSMTFCYIHSKTTVCTEKR